MSPCGLPFQRGWQERIRPWLSFQLATEALRGTKRAKRTSGEAKLAFSPRILTGCATRLLRARLRRLMFLPFENPPATLLQAIGSRPAEAPVDLQGLPMCVQSGPSARRL